MRSTHCNRCPTRTPTPRTPSRATSAGSGVPPSPASTSSAAPDGAPLDETAAPTPPCRPDGALRFTTYVLWHHHIQGRPMRTIARELGLGVSVVRRIIRQHAPDRPRVRGEHPADQEVL